MSVDGCNAEILRRENQSSPAVRFISSENCGIFCSLSQLQLCSAFHCWYCCAWMHVNMCLSVSCICLHIFVHASSPLWTCMAQLNRLRSYGKRPFWSVQICWIIGKICLCQVRQIAYLWGWGVHQQQQQAVTFGTVTIQWNAPWRKS